MVKLSDFSEHIQKSFVTSPEIERDILASKIKNKLKDNLTKGLIDEDTFKKAEEQLDNLVKGKKGEGSRGGKIIGHTKSGKPVYQRGTEGHKEFSPQDHSEAADLHAKEAQKHKQESYGRTDKYGRDFHNQLAEHHLDAAKYHEMQSSKKEKESLHPDEKKILADQKKKQIEHHDKMSGYHKHMQNQSAKYALENSLPEATEDFKRHTDLMNHHKSEKERLENEKKGY